MRDLELRANEVDWDAALSNFVDEIIREPVPLHRVALLARLAEATQAAESTAELETGVARIVLRGVQILVSGDASTDDADLFLRLSAVYDGAIGRSRMQESIVFQFVYYAASDEEIEQYVLFAESPAGQWIIARDRAALAAAVDWLERRLRGRLEEAQPSAAAQASAALATRAPLTLVTRTFAALATRAFAAVAARAFAALAALASAPLGRVAPLLELLEGARPILLEEP